VSRARFAILATIGVSATFACGDSKTSGTVAGGTKAGAGGVGAVTGGFLLVPPRLGAVPAAAFATSVSPDPAYPGPHDGTWSVAFVPPIAGTGTPTTPISLRLEYIVNGEAREATAVLTDPVATGAASLYAPLVWTFNLHEDAESVACAPVPFMDCGIGSRAMLQIGHSPGRSDV